MSFCPLPTLSMTSSFAVLHNTGIQQMRDQMICMHWLQTNSIRGHSTTMWNKFYLIPFFCPCHRRYRNYLKQMDACYILNDNNVPPCNTDKSFTRPESFKAHLHDVKQWTHFLLYHFVIQLHEVQPTTYMKERSNQFLHLY